jgi:hypothetical protein
LSDLLGFFVSENINSHENFIEIFQFVFGHIRFYSDDFLKDL